MRQAHSGRQIRNHDKSTRRPPPPPVLAWCAHQLCAPWVHVCAGWAGERMRLPTVPAHACLPAGKPASPMRPPACLPDRPSSKPAGAASQPAGGRAGGWVFPPAPPAHTRTSHQTYCRGAVWDAPAPAHTVHIQHPPALLLSASNNSLQALQAGPRLLQGRPQGCTRIWCLSQTADPACTQLVIAGPARSE